MPVRLNGSTSGYVELAAPAIAGATSLELPTDSIKPGLVLVAAQSFSAVSSVSVNNCFTATYENYRIIAVLTSSADAGCRMRLRVSGSDNTTASSYTYQDTVSDSTFIGGSRSTTDYWAVGRLAGDTNLVNVETTKPAVATYTGMFASNQGGLNGGYISLQAGRHNQTSAYDGFTVYPASGTITGSLQVFGYRKTV